MQRTGRWNDGFAARAGAALVLVVLAEIAFDGDAAGGVIGCFALAWVVALALVRRAVFRVSAARIAAVAALGFALVLVDDPSLLAWTLFWSAVSLAALLPRHRFDDAATWAARLLRHAMFGLVAPWREGGRLATVRRRRGGGTGGVRRVAGLLALPVIGGSVFVALFAGANPVIADALALLALPEPITIIWRTIFAAIVAMTVWASLHPGAWTTRAGMALDWPAAPDAGVATLTLSLVTFNLIFAAQNILDIVFLWSGAPLPGDVTMADYAHRGAYALIVTALLAALFVLVALRPGSAGARSAAVRALVVVWIGQNMLLVASSALRTLNYVDAYGMTVLRLAALAWMALVASGLALIGWRLVAGRSAAWLINANALAAALVLSVTSVVDLGATAAAWNARVALERGRKGPPLDLCYMAELGQSALVPLARLEVHARQLVVRDRIAYLRWQAQWYAAETQTDWRSWTPRTARRLAAVEALVGRDAPTLRPDPDGRRCDGTIIPPPPPLPAPAPLTPAPQR